jgi:asparagine synthase (glutamine-hydrolysing)
MCGINLVLNYEEGEAAIQRMMAATAHRGPDHSAWFKVADGIVMSGNRLKTHDLGTAGNQPIVLEDGTAALVWNGALYNYDELRNHLLGQGVIFTSRADAEVLIHWLRIYGEEGIKQLEGMFSLIFIDKNERKVIVARDSHGKKPLYYSRQNKQWLFSSEARGIMASGLVKKELNSNQYLPFFYFRHSFPDESFFQGVKQVQPGEMITIDFSGQLISSSRREIEHVPVELPSLAQFQGMVVDAVIKNFQADVPIGLILSGGVDSTLLLHSWYQETAEPLHTFTAVFESSYRSKYNDPAFAAEVAKKYRCAHHEILITKELVLQHWEEYIASLDQPIGDSASFLTWMIAREAKQHVKILISGAGADELFSGYDRHKAFRWYLKHQINVVRLSRQEWMVNFFPRRIKKFMKAVSSSPEETYLNFSSLQTVPTTLRSQFLSYYPKGDSPYKSALVWDRRYYLVNDILKIHDNATMAHGVEGRAPYLDKALVALSHGMTEEQHLSLEGKYWMREILKEAGWKKIASRRKLGFGLPLQEWLQEDSDFSRKVFSTVRAFGDASGRDMPEEMRKLAHQPEREKKTAFLQIWNLFILVTWKQQQGL